MGYEFFDTIKKRVEKMQEDAAERKGSEVARQNAIAAGDIHPIATSLNLSPNEMALAEFSAKRMAVVEHVTEKTTGKTKKKGVLTRAIVGTILLPGVGTIIGAATAGSKVNTTTEQIHTKKVEEIDAGRLLITNQRVLFIGRGVISLPYIEIITLSTKQVGFTQNQQLNVKYTAMLEGEHFVISGAIAKDLPLYLKGARNKQ